MEKHRCKLCFKKFSNGRALGGHMRSHMLNLPIPPRREEEEEELEVEEEEETPQPPPPSGGGDTESGSLSSSSSPTSDEEEEGEEKLLGVCYGLRENPKRSFRLVDPEFSVAAAVDAGSVVLQDRESETESSKNPTRRRSKRTRKLDLHHHFHHHDYPHHHHQYQQQRLESQQENISIKKFKFHKTTESSSWAHEPEPVSSISDTTTEEDIAFCLMMLSRDKWKRREQQQQQQQQRRGGGGGRRFVFEDEEQDEEADKSMEETDESDEFKSCKNRSRGKYKCETCKKVFKSYQALGGHRASHKKIKFYNTTATATATPPNKKPDFEQENAGTSGSTPVLEKSNKIHECPVCLRVFSSGQALGGHKRTHVTGQVATTTSTTTTTTPVRTTTHVTSSSTKFGDNLIDLNLPAPVDDDDISQIELSAVSDAEFVNHIKR